MTAFLMQRKSNVSAILGYQRRRIDVFGDDQSAIYVFDVRF